MKRPTQTITLEEYQALHTKPVRQPSKPRPPSPAERLARAGWCPRCDVENGIEIFRYWQPATGRRTAGYGDAGAARAEALEVSNG